MIDHQRLEEAALQLGIVLENERYVELPPDLAKLEQFCHEVSHALALRFMVGSTGLWGLGLSDAVIVELAQYSTDRQNWHEVLAMNTTHRVFTEMGLDVSTEPFQNALKKKGLGLIVVPNNAVLALSRGVINVLRRLLILDVK